MLIFDAQPKLILEILLSSTSHRFYFTELQNATALSPTTVTTVLRKLEYAGIVKREEERFPPETEFRAPRVYYSLTVEAIDTLRLSTTP